MITGNNYLQFNFISNIFWALFLVFTIELKTRFNIDHNQIIFFIMSFSAVFLGTFSILFKKKKIKREFKKEKVKPFVLLILLGAFCSLGYRYCLYYGLQNENAFIVNSLNYTWVIFMVVTAVIMGNTKNQKIDAYSKYMFVLGLIGIFFIFGVFDKNINLSWIYLLMIIAGFLTALDSNIMVKIKNDIIDHFMFIYTIYTGIIALMMLSISKVAPITILPETSEQLGYLIGISIFFIVTMYLWLDSYNKGDKVIVSYMGYIIAILSNSLFLILYDYEVTTSMMIGFIIILGSGMLLNPNIKNKIEDKLNYKKNLI